MLRGIGTDEEKEIQEEKEDELEEEIILEILKEGRGDRDNHGEREEWDQHIGWHRKEDIGLKQHRKRHKQDHSKKKNKINGKARPAVADDEGKDNRSDHTIEETTAQNVGGGKDLLHDHDHRDGLPLPRNNWLEDANESHRYSNGAASLPWWLSSSVIQRAVLATVFFGFVVYWIVRKNPSRLRSFHRRNTKGRTL